MGVSATAVCVEGHKGVIDWLHLLTFLLKLVFFDELIYPNLSLALRYELAGVLCVYQRQNHILSLGQLPILDHDFQSRAASQLEM